MNIGIVGLGFVGLSLTSVLASKEMYIGRYYFDKKKWIPAINRFKAVINNYETTVIDRKWLT